MNPPDSSAGAATAPQQKLKIDAELLPFFKEEAAEIFGSIEQSLAAWEANPADLAPAKALYRNFHTLKGSANSIGLGPIGKLSNAMEQIMKSISEGGAPADLTVLAPAIRSVASGLQILLQELTPDSCCSRLFAELETRVAALGNRPPSP